MISLASFYGRSETRTISSTLKLGAGSPRVQVLNVDTASLICELPDARKLRTGGIHFMLANIGTESIAVHQGRAAPGASLPVSPLVTLAADKTATLCLVSNATAAGEWLVRLGDVNSSSDPAQTAFLYKFGGRRKSTVPATGTVQQYNPQIDAWVVQADNAAAQRWEAAGFQIANRCYLTQAFNLSDANRRKLWEYDVSSETWTERAEVQIGGVFLEGRSTAGTAIGAFGYIVGGESLGVLIDKPNLRYSAGGDSWAQMAEYTSSQARHVKHIMVNDGTNIHSAGGRSDGGGSPSVANGYRTYTVGTDAWSAADAPSVPILESSAFWHGSYGYVCGGKTNTSTTDANTVDLVQRFDPTGTWTWAIRTPMLHIVSMHGSDVLEGGGYALGGRKADDTGYDDLHRYDPGTDAWAVRAPMDGERWGIEDQVMTASTS